MIVEIKKITTTLEVSRLFRFIKSTPHKRTCFLEELDDIPQLIHFINIGSKQFYFVLADGVEHGYFYIDYLAEGTGHLHWGIIAGKLNYFKIVKKAFDKIVESGIVENMIGFTPVWNKSAIKVAHHLGFKDVKVLKDHFKGEDFLMTITSTSYLKKGVKNGTQAKEV